MSNFSYAARRTARPGESLPTLEIYEFMSRRERDEFIRKNRDAFFLSSQTVLNLIHSTKPELERLQASGWRRLQK